MSALLEAVRARLRAPGQEASQLMMPLRGGAGSLLPRRMARHLISTATRRDGDGPSGGLAGWLERIQAVRSALVMVPDRPTGVAIALRWSLSPEKFRLEGDFGLGPIQAGPADVNGRPWHAR